MAISIPDRVNVLWFLPTHDDSRCLGAQGRGRTVLAGDLKT
ncbi:hypothetical protein [Methylocystis bryophila]|nr:hypothetical protein [Methylocystis bryophila]